ncbi:hypothetical protein [Rhodococcus sp. NPDC003348]
MNATALRAAVVAVVTPLLLIGPCIAGAAAVPITPDPVHPVVLIGQKTDPLGALLACAGTGLIPVFGPNIIFPICLA